MELISKTRLAESAEKAAAFLDKAFHGNASWQAVVRLEQWPRLNPQISYRVYDRRMPEPPFFDISFVPISQAECILHITNLISGAALSGHSAGYLPQMRCELFCIEIQTLIAAKDSPQIDSVDAASRAVRKLCQEWAARDILTGNLSDFLREYQNTDGSYYSVRKFKRLLVEAGQRGWIKKVRGRWRTAG